MAFVRYEDGQVVFHIARRLKTPNLWQGRHWRYKDNETRAWEAALLNAYKFQFQGDIMCGENPRKRRRVIVTRLVPSRRNFIRDEDNLRFSTKPLNDALKRLGWISDDSRAWLEQPLPEQRVSDDGVDWTLVAIGPAGPGAALVVPERGERSGKA